MTKPFSRKLLTLELVRRGVMPNYAWRVTGELADHADDIAAAGHGTSDTLGDVDRLTNQIVEAYRRRTFAGRHPVLSLVVAPLPFICLAYIAYWFVGVLLIRASMEVTDYASIAVLVVHVGGMFIPSMLVASSVCRSARRAGRGWKVASVACLPVLMFSFGAFFSNVTLDSLAHGRFTIGICLPWFGPVWKAAYWPVPLEHRLCQVALPLCVMVWLFVRERALAKRLLNAGSADSSGDSAVHRTLEAA